MRTTSASAVFSWYLATISSIRTSFCLEGLVPMRKHPFAQSLNYEIAKTLGAEIVFVTALGNNTVEQLKYFFRWFLNRH